MAHDIRPIRNDRISGNLGFHSGFDLDPLRLAEDMWIDGSRHEPSVPRLRNPYAVAQVVQTKWWSPKHPDISRNIPPNGAFLQGNVSNSVGVSAHFEQLLKQLAQQHVNATWPSWFIAQEELGNGKRWKDIRLVNQQRGSWKVLYLKAI